MKCLNCDNKAFYELTGSVKGQVFCKSHLPWTVSLKKDLGSKVLVIEEPNIPVVVEMNKKPKKKDEVVEEKAPEVVVEKEVVVEEEK